MALIAHRRTLVVSCVLIDRKGYMESELFHPKLHLALSPFPVAEPLTEILRQTRTMAAIDPSLNPTVGSRLFGLSSKPSLEDSKRAWLNPLSIFTDLAID
jgi:hypothetical protein